MRSRRNATATSEAARDNDARLRSIAAVTALVAVSLVIASALHLSGLVHGRSEPFDADNAGVAEAIIAVVLAGGAFALAHASAHARRIAIAALSFAIVGFGVGLNFTARGGDLPDVAYHLTILPVLVISLIALMRSNR
jgi:hypothetical protein